MLNIICYSVTGAVAILLFLKMLFGILNLFHDVEKHFHDVERHGEIFSRVWDSIKKLEKQVKDK